MAGAYRRGFERFVAAGKRKSVHPVVRPSFEAEAAE
jgi:hypothetical protein